MFDLSLPAPDPVYLDMPKPTDFQPAVIRVVNASSTATFLLVGGADTSDGAKYPGMLVYGSVAAGSTAFDFIGSTVLPDSNSDGDGITALTQTSPLLRNFVLASTGSGVFKCAYCMPDRALQVDWM